jgi:hypothetical protein
MRDLQTMRGTFGNRLESAFLSVRGNAGIAPRQVMLVGLKNSVASRLLLAFTDKANSSRLWSHGDMRPARGKSPTKNQNEKRP